MDASKEKKSKKIRVLIAKPGLNGHDRGAKVIARALRDAGMEVIYTGIRQTPKHIVETAIQEDVDVIGVSSLSGAHDKLMPRIMELLLQDNVRDKLVLAGGIVPAQDIPILEKIGVSKVFGPGTPTYEIVNFIRDNVRIHK
ncbi:MAG: cobalamin B12-binding domain-containing protein [Candidatus Bathyarchaeia archaeon]